MGLLMLNPNYDLAVRYLLEADELARDWLGAVVGRKINQLEMQPYCAKPLLRDTLLGLLRLDYVADIETDAGEQQVLLQLRKAKHRTEIVNSLLGLAGEFAHLETSDTFATIKSSLPQLAIYLLGCGRRLSPVNAYRGRNGAHTRQIDTEGNGDHQ